MRAIVISSDAFSRAERPTFHLAQRGRPICSASLWHGWDPDQGDTRPTSTWIIVSRGRAELIGTRCRACFR